MVTAWPRLLPMARAQQGPLFVMPHAIVLLLVALAAITFPVEGAMLDWGALLLVGAGLAGKRRADWVFASGIVQPWFSTALWPWLALRCCWSRRSLPSPWLASSSLSNLVPVLFRRAGTQKTMPAALAIAAVTTAGYAGVLASPAGVGFVAKTAGLPTAFWMLAALMCVVTLSARIVATDRS